MLCSTAAVTDNRADREQPAKIKQSLCTFRYKRQIDALLMNRRNENSRNGNSPSKNDKRNGIGFGSLKNETNGRGGDEACPNTNELHAADGCSLRLHTDQDHHQRVVDRRTALDGKK